MATPKELLDAMIAQVEEAEAELLSCEPLLGPLDLTYWLDEDANGFVWRDGNAVQWLIIGGESGPKARPFDVGWARSLVAQCRAAGVAPFVKQLGTRPVAQPRPEPIDHDGEPWPLKLRDRHGGDPTEWPEDLRQRFFPEADR